MNQAFICDAIRTPIGRYGGTLAAVRADDLGAVPLKALMERNPQVDWAAVEDIIYGCANQAGEDNRNVARMSGLLAGLPTEVSADDVLTATFSTPVFPEPTLNKAGRRTISLLLLITRLISRAFCPLLLKENFPTSVAPALAVPNEIVRVGISKIGALRF